jgi:hypothetical protein
MSPTTNQLQITSAVHKPLGENRDRPSKPAPNASYLSVASQDSTSAAKRPHFQEALTSNSPLNSEQSYPPEPPEATSLSRFWNKAWLMLVFYLMAVGGVLGHHFFYQSLNGKYATNQLREQRYGGVFAYLVKGSLVAAILLAYRQQIWATLRRRKLTVDAIDSLFAASDDPRAILNWEFMKSAKTAFSLAILVWFTALIVVLTPSTLTVRPGTDTIQSTCPNVRTLNFSTEVDYDWRFRTRIEGFPELPVSMYNNTRTDDTIHDAFNSTFFDYWTGIMPSFDRVEILGHLLQDTVDTPNPSVDICGGGWNCSYTLSFVAPGYQCLTINDTQDPNLSFNSSWMMPQGDYSYMVNATLGEYLDPQMDMLETEYFPNDTIPAHLGVFKTEPVIYAGVSEIVDPSIPLPANRTSDGWNTAFRSTIYACTHHYTNYTIQFNHSLSGLTTEVLHREYLAKVVDTVVNSTAYVDDGTRDHIVAEPQSNYIYPLDVQRYRLTGAYHAFGWKLRSYLDGWITHKSTGASLQNTLAIQSRIVNKETYFTNPDFPKQLERYYLDLILSLFSNPSFLAVTWAADPSISPGHPLSNSTNLLYPCTKNRIVSKYFYSARDLWIVYAIFLILSAIAVAFGVLALVQDDMNLRTTRFSAIVAATRARCLDELPWLRSSRSGGVLDEVRRTKLGYGRIADEVDHLARPTYGFGTVEKVGGGMTEKNLGEAKRVFSVKRWWV